MKLAEDDVRVSGYDTMDRESGCRAEAPAAPCRALRAWISRRRTSPSKRSRSCGATRPRTSDSKENWGEESTEKEKQGDRVIWQTLLGDWSLIRSKSFFFSNGNAIIWKMLEQQCHCSQWSFTSPRTNKRSTEKEAPAPRSKPSPFLEKYL